MSALRRQSGFLQLLYLRLIHAAAVLQPPISQNNFQISRTPKTFSYASPSGGGGGGDGGGGGGGGGGDGGTTRTRARARARTSEQLYHIGAFFSFRFY